jgi:predicted GNAT family N-acyltransferase
MTAFQIVEIMDKADQRDAFAIRHAVFCDEQRVDPALEFDGLDDGCRQYLARCDDIAVGTARIRDAGDGVIKIERVAVLAAERGKGFGKALMVRTIEDSRAAGAATITIHAQCHAENFYQALGFKRIGGMFDEADIPHVRMELA